MSYQTSQYFWVRHKSSPRRWVPAELITPTPPTPGFPKPVWVLMGLYLPVDGENFAEVGPALVPPPAPEESET